MVEREKQGSRAMNAPRLDTQRETLIARESRLAEREAVLKKRLDEKVDRRLREARARSGRGGDAAAIPKAGMPSPGAGSAPGGGTRRAGP